MLSRVIVGKFNIAEATKAVVLWNDGHQTTHELTKGTFIIDLMIVNEILENIKQRRSIKVLKITRSRKKNYKRY